VQDGNSSRERDQLGEINSRLLQAMGGVGRWNADRLIEASGLSAREVNVALTYLQLGGRIRKRDGVFEPI
jgi:predicted Rossmann fold nucleotide-binding protein DprA/Smf involved in DNA uptake